MRTLKKTLCLVLALVMVLGLGAFSVSAADLTDLDDASPEYEEAIAVVTTVGALIGDENDELNPEKPMTRGEGAVAMARMLGYADPTTLPNTSPFTDLPDWAAGAVSLLYSEGITNGVSDTEYNPGGEMTGEQFAKFLLIALGYTQEGLDDGTQWELVVAKLLMKSADVTKGVTDYPALTAITREQCAQMMYDALQLPMVEYDNNGKRSEVAPASGSAAYAYLGKIGNGTNLTLGEMLYQGRLEYATAAGQSATDDFGHTNAKQWKYKATANAAAKAIYTEENKVTLSGTATKTNIDSSGVQATLRKIIGNNNLTYADAAYNKVYVNGNDVSSGFAYSDIKAGDIVDVYANNNAVSRVVISRYTLAKVKSVTDLTASEISGLSNAEKGSTKKIVLTVASSSGGTDLAAIKDKSFADFNYAVGDYVLVALNNAQNKVLASKAAEYVEGTVVATQASKGSQIDGTYYLSTASSDAADYIGVNTATVGASGKWYLDAAGALAAFVGEGSGDAITYLYVYSIIKSKSVAADGTSASAFTVYGVNTAGELESYPTKLSQGTNYILGDAGTVFGDVSSNWGEDGANIPVLVPYKLIDGNFAVDSSNLQKRGQATSGSVDKTSAKVTDDVYHDGLQSVYYANDDTDFISVQVSASGVTVSTKTGYKNVNISGKQIDFLSDGTSITTAFIADAVSAANTDAIYAVLLDANPVIAGTGNNQTATYSILDENGKTELVLTATQYNGGTNALSGLSSGDIFYYSYSGNTFNATQNTDKEYVEYVNDNQVEFSGYGTVDITGAKFFTVTKNATTNTWTAAEGGELSATAKTANQSTGYTVILDTTGDGSSVPYAVKSIWIIPNP